MYNEMFLYDFIFKLKTSKSLSEYLYIWKINYNDLVNLHDECFILHFSIISNYFIDYFLEQFLDEEDFEIIFKYLNTLDLAKDYIESYLVNYILKSEEYTDKIKEIVLDCIDYEELLKLNKSDNKLKHIVYKLKGNKSL